MPAILSKPRRSDAFRFFRSGPVLGGFICALVAVGIGAWMLQAHTGQSRVLPAAAFSTPASKCSAPDQTFCPVEASFVRFVETGDFSDLLEAQVPVPVNCDTPGRLASACAGAVGLTVQAYEINISGTISRFSRNSYINYFNRLLATTGTLHYSGLKNDDSGPTIQFRGTKSGALQLPFQLQDGQWHVQTPMVQ
jgi:hypothetical protein